MASLIAIAKRSETLLTFCPPVSSMYSSNDYSNVSRGRWHEVVEWSKSKSEP